MVQDLFIKTKLLSMSNKFPTYKCSQFYPETHRCLTQNFMSHSESQIQKCCYPSLRYTLHSVILPVKVQGFQTKVSKNNIK